jgi:hypothetical protein
MSFDKGYSFRGIMCPHCGSDGIDWDLHPSSAKFIYEIFCCDCEESIETFNILGHKFFDLSLCEVCDGKGEVREYDDRIGEDWHCECYNCNFHGCINEHTGYWVD